MKPIFTWKGNTCRGLSISSIVITPTPPCGKRCPHVRPHPGLTNIVFDTVFVFLYYFHLEVFRLWRNTMEGDPAWIKNTGLALTTGHALKSCIH